ncbi:LysR family transcriptional regulator [Neptuniibacter sp.]|uniref:LysR family transcriptional regulator n=1 Tax=Neptuniibacter sp. TaxID=1962643 RepID=UPI00261A2ED4|nr:LysR family transcriptional regulator [Neptuniibacter sp.]MCP4598238.1 LysR family transcriptional regulator [Neptuniibacter sp.]
MDTNTLQAFLAVAESGSFSKAADHLFLTQSAVSKRVALLEEQLGSKLFDRIGRSISMTEAGSALLPRARDILLQLDDAKRAINNLSGGDITGTLSLAASHHISLHRLPGFLRQFSEECPQVELDLRFEESEVAYEGVLKGDLELALITLSPEPDPNIHSEIIWDDLLMYVVAEDHPLANKHEVELAELTDFNAILPGSNTFTRSLVEQLFDNHELNLNVTMSTNYLDTIRMMVSIGLGWSLLPESLIGKGLKVLNVVDSEPVHRNLGIIFHRNRTLSNAAAYLVDILKYAGKDDVTKR